MLKYLEAMQLTFICETHAYYRLRTITMYIELFIYLFVSLFICNCNTYVPFEKTLKLQSKKNWNN